MSRITKSPAYLYHSPRVAYAPWYHLFKGERINGHHLIVDEE